MLSEKYKYVTTTNTIMLSWEVQIKSEKSSLKPIKHGDLVWKTAKWGNLKAQRCGINRHPLRREMLLLFEPGPAHSQGARP